MKSKFPKSLRLRIFNLTTNPKDAKRIDYLIKHLLSIRFDVSLCLKTPPRLASFHKDFVYNEIRSYNPGKYHKGDIKMANDIRAEKITVSINMQNAHSDKKKPFVFVLMPFHHDFDDIYVLGIKAACQAVGARCERVDEQVFTEDILKRVYQQIEEADIVVSEMTGKNPNVFYETGYAHAYAKQVILLTQNKDDIPFDLMHYPHIIYDRKIVLLKSELEKRLKGCIDHPVTAQHTPSRWIDYVNKARDEENTSFCMRYLEHSILQEKVIELFIEPEGEPTQNIIDNLIENQPCYLKINLSDGDPQSQIIDKNKKLVGELRYPLGYKKEKYYLPILKTILDGSDFCEVASSVSLYKIDKLSFVSIMYQRYIVVRIPIEKYAYPWG